MVDAPVPVAPGTRWPWSIVLWLAVGAVAIIVAARAMSPTHAGIALRRQRARGGEGG